MIKFRSFLFSLNRFCTPSKPEIYTYPYNVNKQQNRKYVQQVNRQLENTLDPETNPIPRRKRRIYDRPKFDISLQNYGAWRLFNHQRMILFGEESTPMAFKIMLIPKEVKHALGRCHSSQVFVLSSCGEHWFQDNNLSQFVLYEWRNTTNYQLNDPYFDYEHQQDVEPRKRKVKRMEPEEFWNHDLPVEFRVTASTYSEHHKFKQWLKQKIESTRGKESYDQEIDAKFGKTECYNQFEQARQVVPPPAAVQNITKSMFEQKASGKKKQADPVVKPFQLPRKPSDQFRVTSDMTIFAKEDKDKEEEEQRRSAKMLKATK